ncbi:aldo/keto reductase [Agromyces sp. MMS24-JH15]|uniref:aldo/keto reductase n=1 Tax=Agromyces sp. MMS24-JH15 TaxID=3243765 RepID=UPI003748FB11
MSAVRAAERVVLGRTGLAVAPVTIGTAAWGTASPVHGIVVPEADAIATVRAALAGPLNLVDTSNNYGDGESERRIGAALAGAEVPDGFLVQTKLDRDPETGSFDGDRMRRSLEESLGRLGLERVPLLFLHDPEHISFEDATAPGGAVDTLVALRDEGWAERIGISGGPTRLLRRFVDLGLFDALITHNRFTLVDRTADELIDAAHEAGLGVQNAAVYGGGILSSWPRRSDRYHYAPAPAPVLAAVDAMGAACERHGVPLIAAALQSSTRDPRIHTTICGMVNPAQVADTVAMLDIVVPDELWDELDRLRPGRSTWIDD